MTPGTKLGPYEILAPIGAGGMGEVYRARDTRLDRIVALKVSKGPFTERFEREARVVASLNHPNIASLFDVGPNYLVMEYVEGEPLSGPLPIDRVMQYAAQICDALDAAHRKGITHRDLKPANILVSKQGIKLLDFGLAKIREEPEVSAETISAALTAQGAVLGTPQYMAPEQVEGKEADSRTDIFALGCVLYEMLTGRKAFAGKNASTIAAAILAKDPEPIENLPAAVERVIKTCLAKDPDDRFQNARDVKIALQWTAQPDVAPPVAEKKWLPWAAVAALGLVAVTFALLHLWQSPTAPERPVQFQVQAPENTQFDHDTAPLSVSPDGRMIAFAVASQDGKSPLWIRSLDSMTSRPLAGTEGAKRPSWSPDSRFLAFWADKKLKRIEVTGGTPQTICEMPQSGGITWNEAGDILFAGDRVIRKVAASGGSPSDLLRANAPGEPTLGGPYFLPDGQHFLFAGGASGSTVYVASLDGKGGRKILLDEKNRYARFVAAPDRKRSGVPGYLLYLAAGSVLMWRPFDPDKLEFAGDAIQIAEGVDEFSASPSGVVVWLGIGRALSQATWLDDKGKPLGPVGTPEELRGDLALSPDGKRVAVSRRQSDRWDVWTLDLERGGFSRLTSGGVHSAFPVSSRRGSRIFFSQAGAAKWDLYSIGSDGGSAELVLSTPNTKMAEDTSPDGRFLLYRESDGKKFNIWAIPLEGDRKPFPVFRSEFDVYGSKFSPDGRWLAYVSDESGADQVYVKAFPPTERRWQLSIDGGTRPMWRRDGRQLYYRSKDRLMAVDLKLGSEVEASKPRELFSVRGPCIPMPDGKRFLALTTDETKGAALPLNVIVNFPATLLRSKP